MVSLGGEHVEGSSSKAEVVSSLDRPAFPLLPPTRRVKPPEQRQPLQRSTAVLRRSCC